MVTQQKNLSNQKTLRKKKLEQVHQSDEFDIEAILELPRDEEGQIMDLIDEKEDKQVYNIETSTSKEISDK